MKIFEIITAAHVSLLYYLAPTTSNAGATFYIREARVPVHKFHVLGNVGLPSVCEWGRIRQNYF